MFRIISMTKWSLSLSDILIFLLTSQNEYFKQVGNIFTSQASHLKKRSASSSHQQPSQERLKGRPTEGSRTIIIA